MLEEHEEQAAQRERDEVEPRQQVGVAELRRGRRRRPAKVMPSSSNAGAGRRAGGSRRGASRRAAGVTARAGRAACAGVARAVAVACAASRRRPPTSSTCAGPAGARAGRTVRPRRTRVPGLDRDEEAVVARPLEALGGEQRVVVLRQLVEAEHAEARRPARRPARRTRR